jgi:hypothetical protein
VARQEVAVGWCPEVVSRSGVISACSEGSS